MNYQSFKVEIKNHIATVWFNKPQKANALDVPDWKEMKQVFDDLDAEKTARVIVLRGEGKHFCAGMDLNALMALPTMAQSECPGRQREGIRRFVKMLQGCITAIEDCRKPVLAAIHNACIGGGTNLIAACDMRFCTNEAYFSIKEVDLGIVADIGALQRLPKMINPGILADLAFTGRRFYGPEAKEVGLVNETFEDQEAMLKVVYDKAAMIAAKSPLVVRGIKEMLLYQRDHSVADSLNYVATWNAGMVISNDIQAAMQANFSKSKPEFED